MSDGFFDADKMIRQQMYEEERRLKRNNRLIRKFITKSGEVSEAALVHYLSKWFMDEGYKTYRLAIDKGLIKKGRKKNHWTLA